MSAVLTAQGLTVRFGGLTALDALDLELRPREVLGLIGPNGSGKTTFFNALTGLYRPAAGRVVVDGRDLTGATPQAISRAGVARTFQRSRLCLSLSVFDNLMIGDHRNLDHGLWANLVRRRYLARQVGQAQARARELLAIFSAPLAGRMSEAVAALSMIDRRRVEICRALIGGPRILLLDEPSAGMTHDETHELMADLLAVREKLPSLAVILIEHEMNVIERVTGRCMVLNYGRKIREGSYREVAADAQVRQAYLGED
ncbi:MAG TPA: ABC transporter ATP-binding protein [Burkholderiales bacterium]|nr:ABC transporter ATP-binding protein [Burkholderiales bacterium]